jgi:hypothetical protein
VVGDPLQLPLQFDKHGSILPNPLSGIKIICGFPDFLLDIRGIEVV